jgi:peptidyl-prolyl cis-trans isomerase C
VTRLLKDPLLHFLVLGGVIFAVAAWRAEDSGSRADRIVIGAAQVEQLRRARSLALGREPTRAELESDVETAIRSEVFYREALALELDRNDDEVRRRLIEKMQYLTQDVAEPEAASNETLRGFFAAHPALFRVPATVNFDQVFFDPAQRKERVDEDAAAARERLVSGADPAGLGDSTPLQHRFTDAPRSRLDVLFGQTLTDALFSMQTGTWNGPYRSDFGLHVVRVLERKPSRDPPFDEVRDDVAKAYAEQQRRQENEAAYAQLRSHYDVVVEWPGRPSTEAPR